MIFTKAETEKRRTKEKSATKLQLENHRKGSMMQ